MSIGLKTITPRVAPTSGTTKLDNNTKMLLNDQTILDLTKRGDSNPGIVDNIVAMGEVINASPIPPKITVTVINDTASDDLLDINIFNNNVFEDAPSDVTITYSDGFDGKLIEQLIRSVNNGKGLLIYGFNVTGYDEDGVKSDVVINDMGLTMNYYIGKGKNSQPNEIDLSGSERNTQFKDGLFTVKVPFIVNIVSQLRMSLGGNGRKIQFVFFTQPIKD